MFKFPMFAGGHVIKLGVRRRDIKRMYYALYHPKGNRFIRWLNGLFGEKTKKK